jgi:hypothetical protein
MWVKPRPLGQRPYVCFRQQRTSAALALGSNVPILLQKSKVARLGIFRENTTRELIADSYTLSRVTEVACAFNVKR